MSKQYAQVNHWYFLKFVWQFSILYDLFFLLSLVFVFIYLFVFVFVLSPYFWHSRTHPIPLPILWFYCTSSKKIFLTLHFFFFLSLILVIAQPPVDKEQIVKHYTNIFSNLYKLYSFSLYLSYLYNIRERERVTNTEWLRVTKPKRQKKKKKYHRQSSTDSIHNHQHQFITQQ